MASNQGSTITVELRERKIAAERKEHKHLRCEHILKNENLMWAYFLVYFSAMLGVLNTDIEILFRMYFYETIIYVVVTFVPLMSIGRKYFNL